MFHWIAIVLMIALPLRSGLAAVQFCPWMAAQEIQMQMQLQADPSAANTSMAGAMDDCPEMSATGGACQLQKACTITPILLNAPAKVLPHAQPVHAAWRSVFAISIDTAVPQPVPIAPLS